jgi:hypothetical protein
MSNESIRGRDPIKKKKKGHAMGQVVIYWFLTAEALGSIPGNLCGICFPLPLFSS